MQVERIILWGPRDEPARQVVFRRGELNVITGWSETGKTAIAPILEFCLGRESFEVFRGVIQDTVRWYGCVVRAGADRLLLARPQPPKGQKSSSRAMLEILGPIEDAALVEPEQNIDADALQGELGRRIGIEENLHVPEVGQTRNSLEANVSHALMLCIQRQNEIANPEILFHRQGSEDFIGQAIRDTLPYFLGAVDSDSIGLRRERRRKRTQLRESLSDLRAQEETISAGRQPASELVARARAVGLTTLQTQVEHDEWEVLEQTLETHIDAQPLGGEDRLRTLLKRREILIVEERELRERLDLIDNVARERGSFEVEAQEQGARLESLHLLGSGDSPDCPVCGRPHSDGLPAESELLGSLERLRLDLSTLESANPRLEELRDETGSRAREAKLSLRTVSREINELLRAQAASERLADQIGRQAFVRGEITHFLNSNPRPDEREIVRARERVDRLEGEVERLDERLSNDLTATRVQSALSLIGKDMTSWAQRLELGHADHPVRIDLTALNVVVDDPDGMIPLSQIGSAKNWVGYHIVAHLALHKWFAERDRPVPRFVIFDQPTQAFYPQDQRATQDHERLNDEDRRAVHAMFKLMSDVAKQLGPEVQIIVTDHANLSDKWFQDAVVEDWHQDIALIPSGWIKTPSEEN